MKRAAMTVLAVALALCVTVPAEAGKPKKRPTEPGINAVFWNPGAQQAGAEGLLGTVERCEADRVVRAFALTGGVSSPLDVTLSDGDGFWNVSGNASPKPDAIKIKVERKRAGSTVCKRGVATQAVSG